MEIDVNSAKVWLLKKGKQNKTHIQKNNKMEREKKKEMKMKMKMKKARSKHKSETTWTTTLKYLK